MNADEQITRVGASCGDGSEAVEYRLEHAGQVWPNLESHALGANNAIWEFFSAHARTG